MLSTFDPPDDAEWTLTGSAAIGAYATPVSSPNVLSLFARRSTVLGNTNSTATRVVAIVKGRPTPVRMWVNGDGASTIQLRLIVTDSIGQHTYTITSAIGAGWQLWEPFTYTGPDKSVTLALNTPTPGSGGGGLGTGGTWYVDDLEVDESWNLSMLSKWSAVNASLDVLKGIDGSSGGSYSDLAQRVYTRLVLPTEMPDIAKPYCCLPLDQEGERIEYEGQMFTSTWRMIGHAFFDDNQESDPLNSDGSLQAAKFRDDLIRAFMADQSLGGQVINCEVQAIDTSSGVIDDGIAEVIFTIEFTQMGAASDLQVA